MELVIELAKEMEIEELNNYIKALRNIKNQKKKQKVMSDYYKEHKGGMLDRGKVYYKDNREDAIRKAKEYYQKNKERIKEREQEKYFKKKEEAWKEEHGSLEGFVRRKYNKYT